MKKFLSFALCLAFVLVFSLAGCSSPKSQLKQASEGANSYQISATLNTDNTLSASEVVTFKNTTNSTLEELKFHLHPNAFSKEAEQHKATSLTQEKKAFDNQKSYGKIDITKVSSQNTQKTFALSNENQILSINLEEKLPANQSVSVEIEFSLVLPNANHRFGYGKDTLNLGNWYPILCVFEGESWDTECYNSSGDPFYSQIANYEVSITYPKNLTMASTGDVVLKNTNQNTKTDVLTAKAVRDFALVFSEKFEVLSQKVGETTLNYFYFEDENAQTHLKTCVDALTTFNNLFGDYPYKTLNVAKANFLQGGMEFPNLVFVSSSIENEPEYNNVIVHEIAHQWWYGVVGNNQLLYAWIDEGLAEFSTALFYDSNEGYDFTYSQVVSNAISSYLLFYDVYKTVYDDFNPAINRPVSSFKTEMEYTYITYVKSLLMFDSLKQTIGETKTKKCLKALYGTFAFSEVTPSSLLECFEKACGRKTTKFLQSWLDGTVVLEQLA